MPGDHGQRPHHARHHHPARLHLRRLQGRGARAHPRHRQHHPRAHRLRLLFLAHPPQPDPAAHATSDENFMTYCFSTDMQEEDIIFGGEKKLPPGDPGGLRPVPSQGDRRLLHLPGGPDRRRRARRGPRNEGEARHQRLRLQLRGLQGRQPVGRPPHRQQRPVQARHRPGRHAAQGQVQHQPCWANTTSAATPS